MNNRKLQPAVAEEVASYLIRNMAIHRNVSFNYLLLLGRTGGEGKQLNVAHLTALTDVLAPLSVCLSAR